MERAEALASARVHSATLSVPPQQNATAHEMDIGDVTRRTGLPASALRYYESKGLIRTNARVGARRQFADDVLERLAP